MSGPDICAGCGNPVEDACCTDCWQDKTHDPDDPVFGLPGPTMTQRYTLFDRYEEVLRERDSLYEALQEEGELSTRYENALKRIVSSRPPEGYDTLATGEGAIAIARSALFHPTDPPTPAPQDGADESKPVQTDSAPDQAV